jgi:hypothetical protein
MSAREHARPRARNRGRVPDRGRVSVFVAATMPVMLLFMALMWDASGYLRALHRADNIANEAARAAGQAIDIPLVMAGEDIVVDEDAAQAAAAAYLADAGLVDTSVAGAVLISDDGRRLRITVEVVYEPLLLDAFGFGTPPVATGVAEAHLVDG